MSKKPHKVVGWIVLSCRVSIRCFSDYKPRYHQYLVHSLPPQKACTQKIELMVVLEKGGGGLHPVGSYISVLFTSMFKI